MHMTRVSLCIADILRTAVASSPLKPLPNVAVKVLGSIQRAQDLEMSSRHSLMDYAP